MVEVWRVSTVELECYSRFLYKSGIKDKDGNILWKTTTFFRLISNESSESFACSFWKNWAAKERVHFYQNKFQVAIFKLVVLPPWLILNTDRVNLLNVTRRDRLYGYQRKWLKVWSDSTWHLAEEHKLLWQIQFNSKPNVVKPVFFC